MGSEVPKMSTLGLGEVARLVTQVSLCQPLRVISTSWHEPFFK
jgi:hypothetical protein